jgi:dTDP-4-dehydrorhamnose 3,5-epimerase
MKVSPLAIADVLVIEPRLFRDDRGFFFEVFNEAAFERECGIRVHFVQQNFSRSKRNVLRGLHYQIQQAQGKLVRAAAGEIYDVVVDLRRSSKTFGKWTAHTLTAESQQAIWVPAGFAHGFLVLSESADVIYNVTDYWAPQHERRILWNDPAIGVEWPLSAEPIVSKADLTGTSFEDSELFE